MTEQLIAVATDTGDKVHAAWPSSAKFPAAYVTRAQPQLFLSRCGRWMAAVRPEQTWSRIPSEQRCKRCESVRYI